MAKVLCTVAFLLFVCPAAAWADYTAQLTAGSAAVASLVGDADGDELIIDSVGNSYRHNRFSAGDPGFTSDLDWDTTVAGEQRFSDFFPVRVVIDAGGGVDRLFIDDRVRVLSAKAAYTVTTTSIERAGLRVDFNASGFMEDVLLGAGTGANVVTLRGSDARTPDSLPLTIDLGDGNDRVELGENGRLDLLQGRTRLLGGGGTDSIAFLDSATTRDSNFQVTSTTVLRGDGHALTTYSGFENLGISSGSGADVFTVTSTQHQTSIVAGAGNNRLVLADNVTLRGGSYTGGAGVDTIDYSAWTTPVVANIGDRMVFRADLSGASVVPATTSTATGTAWLTFVPSTGAIELFVEVAGIPVSVMQHDAAQLHRGAPGVNTSASAFIERGDWSESGTHSTLDVGTGVFASSFLPDLLAGNVYLDLHTTAFPSGEIRGQFSGVSITRALSGITAPVSVDAVIGGSSDDMLFGTERANTLDGRDGADVLFAFGGGDTVTGGNGADVLVGGDGQDVVSAGDGDDLIVVIGSHRGAWSAPSENRIDGGAGTDRVRISTGSLVDVVTLMRNDAIAGYSVWMASGQSFSTWTYLSEHFAGIEAVQLAVQGHTDSVQIGDLTGVGAPSELRVFGGDEPDTMSAALLPAGVIATVLLDGGGWGDTIEGSAGADTLRGDSDSDTLTGGPGADVIEGGTSGDTIVWRDGDGTDTINAGAGTSSDTLSIGSRGEGATMEVATVAGALRVTVGIATTTFDLAAAGLEEITLNGTTGEDVFTVWAPVPVNRINGFGGNDRVHVDAGCQSASISTSFIMLGSRFISLSEIESVTSANTASVSASSTTFNSAGGSGTVSVTAPSCAWVVSTTTPWISVEQTGGTGNGVARYHVVRNVLRNSRSGSITVAGQTFSIFQFGASTAPTSRNDFTGDGTFDLLLHHETDGTIGVWSMNGNIRVDGSTFTPNRVPDVNWRIAGVGDFNADGKPDIVWQHNDGFLAVWLMNGRTTIDAVFLTPSGFADPAWRVRAVADVNKDGHPDLIIEHTTSAHVGVWFMNGTTMTDARLLTPSFMSTEWEIVGAADLDGNGSVDIIFQHDEGHLAAWYMSGTTRLGDPGFLSPMRTPSAAWRVRAVGDIDHDGDADLVIQNMETGELAVYIMSGSSAVYSTPLSPSAMPDPAWKIVGPR
jgi:Ca2+-binding RTX toxin-like protein